MNKLFLYILLHITFIYLEAVDDSIRNHSDCLDKCKKKYTTSIVSIRKKIPVYPIYINGILRYMDTVNMLEFYPENNISDIWYIMVPSRYTSKDVFMLYKHKDMYPETFNGLNLRLNSLMDYDKKLNVQYREKREWINGPVITCINWCGSLDLKNWFTYWFSVK